MSLVFWKLRIFDLGTNPRIEIGPIDLYIEHIPMAKYAYDALAAAKMPLWNPYQLCGQPFLAVPHIALLYPLHAFSLFVDASTSVEISFVLHMFLGGSGMWWLARRLSLPPAAAACAAVTFMWSGWIVFTNVVPGIFAGLNWLPLTLVLLDRAVARARFAHSALIAAVCSQILLGATEVLLHTLLVGAVFTALRLVQLVEDEGLRCARDRGVAILGSMLAAALLAAPQLVPSLEFVADSGRASQPVAGEAAAVGAVPPLAFLDGALTTTGLVSVGVLPFLALPFVLGLRSDRFAWLFGAGAALVGALLVFGGPVYEAYHSIPVIGSLFRRPVKFLDVYAFGQALLAGLAITRLHAMTAWSRNDLWRNARWWMGLALFLAACVWTASTQGTPSTYWSAGLIGLLAFGIAADSRIRSGLVYLFVALQAASCFFQVGETHMRPLERPELYHARDPLLAALREREPHQRVYLSSFFTADPSLTAKQGLLSGLRVTSDYEPLSSSRYQRFFDRVAPGDQARRQNPFAGFYSLDAQSNWRLMDLTGTRHYVVASAEPAARFMLASPAEFRAVAATRGVHVFERPSALPRAYVVSRAQILSDEGEMLAVLASAEFDARRTVLLEQGAAATSRDGNGTPNGRVEFVLDEPEAVQLEVRMEQPGWLVLSDADHPGWRATVDGHEVEILRANYLFRAIALEAGRHRVHFEYTPTSFRLGIALSLVTAVALAALMAFGARRATKAT